MNGLAAEPPEGNKLLPKIPPALLQQLPGRKDRDHGPGGYEFTGEIYYLFFWLQASAAR